MKKKIIPINQYAFETKNLEGASDESLEETAPLIGYIVHSFNTYLQFRYTFQKGPRKEHYYQSKENVITIIKLHSEFLAYIYQSYKAIKTVLNTGNLVSAEAMNDFITEYQTRLALSHQMSEIEFPGQMFDTVKINAQLRQLEDSIAAINNDIVAAFEKAGSPLTAALPDPWQGSCERLQQAQHCHYK
jgi:hypothetical protein